MRPHRRRACGVAAVAAAGILVIAGCDLGAPIDTYQVTATGNSASDIVVGDVNNDGHADIVTAVNGGYSVGLNDGSGKFAVTETATGSAPGWVSLALGDVNGDGHLDLAYVGGPPEGPPHVQVRTGDGAGHFAATAQVLPGGNDPRAVALGDLNGDGHLDVTAATATAGVDVWLNDGSGGFGPPVAVATGTSASDVVIADMDRDGVPDLVTGGVSPDAVVSVSRGDGTGGFSAPVTSGLGPVSNFGGSTTVGVADMNGDGIPDVFGGAGAFDQVFVFLGTGSPGTAQLGPAILSPAQSPTVPDLVATDIDVDGHLDLVTAGSPGSTVLFGDGTGHFPENHGLVGGVMVGTADLDGNGQPDLAYAQAEVLRVLLNHMDGRRTHD